jgi:hypothetical protein
MSAKSMMSTHLVAADLRTLLQTVAHSPIRALPARRPEGVFTDWMKERHSAEVDALILAWIASHVRTGAQRSRLH